MKKLILGLVIGVLIGTLGLVYVQKTKVVLPIDAIGKVFGIKVGWGKDLKQVEIDKSVSLNNDNSVLLPVGGIYNSAKMLVMEGIEREILSIGTNLMIVRFTFKKGAEVPWHTHINEQSSYILKGRLKLFIGDDELILSEGMSAIVPPNIKHKAIALEDTIDVNAFTPTRKDFLNN